jgi:hypothetical protein
MSLDSTIQQTPQFVDPLPIAEFISYPDETIVEDESELLSIIINRYAEADSEDIQSDDGEEQEQEEIRQIKLSEAIAALDLLNLFEKQQEGGQIEVIRKLDTIKATIHQRKLQHARQATIDLSTGDWGLVRH